MSVAEPNVQTILLGDAIERAPAAVLVADEDGRYIAANAYACEMLGYERAELLELNVLDVARYDGAREEFDALDEPPLLERAADDESRLDEPRAEVVVDLVAVAVALVHDRLPVRLERPRPLRELDRLRAEPHRAAEVLDLLLLRQQVDDRERRLRHHLGRVGPLEPDHVARVLRHRHVHAETDAEVRDPALARDTAGEELPLPAARAEAAGDE